MSALIKISFFILLTLITFWILLTQSGDKADLILYNGTIYSLNNSHDIAEAIAVKNGKILALGGSQYILEHYPARRTIDLRGKTVLPGFIDSHGHLLGLGESTMQVDLLGLRSPEEAAALVEYEINRVSPGEWIRGRGWDQNEWDIREFPTREILDPIAPENPVYLVRVDGHAVWANSKALDISGVSRDTPDPDGGRVIRDREGNPTGVLIGSAKDLVFQQIPPPSREQLERAVKLAISECLRYGVTTVHDMGVSLETIRLYQDMIKSKNFPIRIYAAIGGIGETWDHYLENGRMVGFGNDRLTVRAIKLYSDGALGSRGAALHEEYSDDSGNYGILSMTEDDLFTVTLDALENGFQVCTHAIGDRGNTTVLNAYNRAINQTKKEDHRLRIEHAQVIALDDFERFPLLNVISSMQPIHATSDMYWAEDRVGPERIKGAYAWRSLLDSGVIIAGGSDFPVEPANPLLGIFAAITRQDENFYPDGGWYPEERVTIGEAVKMFTKWSAIAAFEEEIKGTLEAGKLADMVIFPVDIFKASPEELLKIRPVMTILGGEIVYSKN